MLPPGVLNVVSGGDELGAWMTSHPAVAKISFTGSVPTGKAVAAAAAPDLKRFTLELGGNDAAIVLDDADPAVIERGLFWGAFINNGQICAGIKRIYVPERLHGDVVEALAHRASRVRVEPAPTRASSSARSRTGRSSTGSPAWSPTPWPAAGRPQRAATRWTGKVISSRPPS